MQKMRGQRARKTAMYLDLSMGSTPADLRQGNFLK